MWGSGLLVILLSGGILGGQALNCRMSDVLMRCRRQGGGYNYFDPGTVTSNQEDCKACCKVPGTWACPETDLLDQDLTRAPGRYRRDVVMGNSGGRFNTDLHCPRAQSRQMCRRGRGMRIHNR